jgi:hypothetical protein
MLRVVTKAFAAWDTAVGMTVMINAGVAVRFMRIVFDLKRHPVPPIKRAVEFQSNKAVYYAEFERFEENTSACDPT